MLELISKVEEQILNRKKIKYPETTFPSKLLLAFLPIIQLNSIIVRENLDKYFSFYLVV